MISLTIAILMMFSLGIPSNASGAVKDYTETAEISFTDVKSDKWYYQEVQKALKAGFIEGITETQFGPENNITREQAAARAIWQKKSQKLQDTQ